jgi:hypothetical protein
MFGSVTPEPNTLLHDREQLLESVHLDACHHADRDSNPGGSHIISLSIGFEDGGIHHRVGGGADACGSQPPHWHVRLDTALPASSGRIYVVPAGSAFPLHLHIRDGDSGFFRGFANNPLEDPPAGGCLSTRQAIL